MPGRQSHFTFTPESNVHPTIITSSIQRIMKVIQLNTKLRLIQFGWVMLCLCLLSCKKDPPKEEVVVPEPGVPVVTEAGVPDGTPVAQKVIGAAGGSLASNDKGITINIPAGALTADQTVKITRITSTNPIGSAKGYRLEPHGLTFAKPVTLTINGGDSLLTGTIPEAVGIAFRNDKGNWVAMPGATVNATQKTVSIQTTHFSDWEWFKAMELRAHVNLLEMGTATRLEVVAIIPDLLAPLTKQTYIDAIRVKDSDIKGWTLSSDYGTLTPNGAKATYAAANYWTDHPVNPVAISVEIKGPDQKKYILVTDIRVTAGEVEFNIGGTTHKLYAAPAMRVNGAWHLFANTNEIDGRDITFRIDGFNTPGSFNWTMGNVPNIQCHITMKNQEWSAFYDDPETDPVIFIPSPGTVEVTSIANGFITGTFSGSHFGIRSTMLKTWTRVTGKFRVMMTIE